MGVDLSFTIYSFVAHSMLEAFMVQSKVQYAAPVLDG